MPAIVLGRVQIREDSGVLDLDEPAVLPVTIQQTPEPVGRSLAQDLGDVRGADEGWVASPPSAARIEDP
jgi:hypothetical protein